MDIVWKETHRQTDTHQPKKKRSKFNAICAIQPEQLLKSELKIVITYTQNGYRLNLYIYSWNIQAIHWWSNVSTPAQTQALTHFYIHSSRSTSQCKKSFRKYVINLFNHVHVLLWSIVKLFICYDEPMVGDVCGVHAYEWCSLVSFYSHGSLSFVSTNMFYDQRWQKLYVILLNDRTDALFFSLFFPLSSPLKDVNLWKIYRYNITDSMVNFAILIRNDVWL